MPAENSPRKCLTCNKPLKGRTDKKFCNDYCRNIYNNQLNAGANNLTRSINQILGKNRRILVDVMNEENAPIKVSKDFLLEQGFQFRYFTHMNRNKQGTTYYFCYDYGYLLLENDACLLIRLEN